VREFFSDKIFFATLLKLWLPIAFQQLIFALLTLFTGMMVGQLGETAVAAVGLANQIGFLLNLMLFGMGSGSAIFVAQFWGKRDVDNIRRVLGIALTIGLLGAGAFSFIAFVIPEHALALYSTDRAVIALGSEYLRVVGLSYLPLAITTAFGVTLRSTGNVRLPVTTSVIALTLGAVMNYALIFGAFGLPALGVLGSAIGTAIARALECCSLLAVTYGYRMVAAATLREMFTFERAFLFTMLKTIVPVTVNEIVWSVGVSTYSSIYGRISTESIAAISIAGTIETLAYVPFVALANSAAIMIGNRVGAGEEHKAFGYATRFWRIVLASAVTMGALIFLSADFILGFYHIDATTRELARTILHLIATLFWLKTSNMLFVVGVLRAGGDARVVALIDTVPLWTLGVPLAAGAAFIFGLPAYWVFLCTYSDEVTKFSLAVWRFFSKRWIRNLAREHQRAETP